MSGAIDIALTTCNYNSKGANCGCYAYHYRDYIYYRAIWDIKYKTLDHVDDDCPEKMKYTIH